VIKVGRLSVSKSASTTTATRYLQRYFPAQRLYLDTVRPQRRANAVVENDDPKHPRLRFT
jgi:hypothetical protein